MVVFVLTNCPPKLRGDLSMWLFEINTGVYVGNVSARVRDLLWERICANVKYGRVSMVFSTSGEQKMDLRVHNTSWNIVDYDGLKLMRRPLPQQSVFSEPSMDLIVSEGFSKFSKFEKNKRIQSSKNLLPEKIADYVVLDIETTGLSHLSDDIIEIAALKVRDDKPTEEFQSLVICDSTIPEHINKLTGITNLELDKHGREIHEVLKDLICFIADDLLVCHNASFDIRFIQTVCKKQGISFPRNKYIDTLIMAKRNLKNLSNYRLETIAENLGIDLKERHRALKDCYNTYNVYIKLKEK